MATEISKEDLAELPLLWEDSSKTFRLIQSDERNFEIIQFMHIGGEGKRGRKGVERDAWCSVPMYFGSLDHAFSKILELSAKGILEAGNVKDFRKILEDVKEDFLRQVKNFKILP